MSTPPERDNNGWFSKIGELYRIGGLSLVFIVFFIGVFLCYGTPDQKERFVDRYILFEGVLENPFPFGFVVLVLIVLWIITVSAYRAKLKIRDERIASLEERINRLRTEFKN